MFYKQNLLQKQIYCCEYDSMFVPYLLAISRLLLYQRLREEIFFEFEI